MESGAGTEIETWLTVHGRRDTSSYPRGCFFQRKKCRCQHNYSSRSSMQTLAKMFLAAWFVFSLCLLLTIILQPHFAAGSPVHTWILLFLSRLEAAGVKPQPRSCVPVQFQIENSSSSGGFYGSLPALTLNVTLSKWVCPMAQPD